MGQTPSSFEEEYQTPNQTTLFRYREPTVTELAVATVPHPTQPDSFVKELREIRLRSIDSNQATKITFWNFSGDSVRILWIDYNGHEVSYGFIEPGEGLKFRTFVTHPWIFRNAKTHRRLAINDSEIIIGQPKKTRAIIRNPPLLQWNESRHTFFPSWFKERVRVLLLCHNHLRRWAPCALDGNCMQLIRHLPIEIVKMIVVEMATECQVEQSLVRGVQAAPDLKPVELPEIVPIEQAVPLAPSDGNESTDSSDYDVFTDDGMEE